MACSWPAARAGNRSSGSTVVLLYCALSDLVTALSLFFPGDLLTRPAPVTEWWHTPAERYDVVIDFSPFAGRNVTLHNSAPVELGLPWSCPPNCEPDFNTVGNKKKNGHAGGGLGPWEERNRMASAAPAGGRKFSGQRGGSRRTEIEGPLRPQWASRNSVHTAAAVGGRNWARRLRSHLAAAAVSGWRCNSMQLQLAPQ